MKPNRFFSIVACLRGFLLIKEWALQFILQIPSELPVKHRLNLRFVSHIPKFMEDRRPCNQVQNLQAYTLINS